MTTFTKTVLASLLTFSAAGASAAAFQLAEGSTSGLGMAFSGNAAVADDATVVSSNPALMTKFKQVELSAGGILVDSKIDVEGRLLTGQDASQKSIVPRAVVPNAYLIAPVNDRFSLGGGVNVNYGLKSEFKPEYSAGFFGGSTSLEAVNVNLSGAYKLNEYFSFGVGLNAVHAKASLERYLGNAVELAEAKLRRGIAEVTQKLAFLNQQQSTPENQAAITALTAKQVELTRQLTGTQQINALTKETDTIHKLKGDKWGFGWNVGLLYEINKNHRIGVAYHSAVKLNFKGKYSNNVHMAAESLPVVEKATGGAQIGGSLALTLPAFWEVSGYHKFTDKFAMNYSYKRTDWSTFKSLDAYTNDGVRLFHKTENFNDSSRIAVGFSYDVNEKLTLRSGVAFDESASVTNPSVSIPDTDRTWYSAGFTYRFTPNLSTDFGYSHIRGSKNQFNEEGLADFKVKAKA
ncbi:MAG: outer membrane protein transport protein, partial [Pasteurellaceae bacterium]|nr:outer membrane protein transport protein [Pasteurellaceae bacterium]